MKILSVLCTVIFSLIVGSCVQKTKKGLLVPQQANQFIWLYKPVGDTYPGPSTEQLEAGKFYDDWVPNDHGFIKGPDGEWHIFGITHPNTGIENVHEGEFLSFHALEPESGFFSEKGWLDLPKVLPPSERPNEPLANHAPFIVKKENLYYMVYGPSPMRLAVSEDLYKWELKEELFSEAKGARDPSIIFYNDQYHIVYCTERKVNMRTSTDLINWSEPKTIFESTTTDPESPSIVQYNDSFYLFMCGWNGIWDKKDVQGAYQHDTFVYHSGQIDDFRNKEPITKLKAHAPEIFEYQDKWYISSVEWPNRGVSVDLLEWKSIGSMD
jgi:beta-fructofuranosidase